MKNNKIRVLLSSLSVFTIILTVSIILIRSRAAATTTNTVKQIITITNGIIVKSNSTIIYDNVELRITGNIIVQDYSKLSISNSIIGMIIDYYYYYYYYYYK